MINIIIYSVAVSLLSFGFIMLFIAKKKTISIGDDNVIGVPVKEEDW